MIPKTVNYIWLGGKPKDKINILPMEYFSPYDSGGGKAFSQEMITENTYVIHWFSYSWGKYKNIKWVKVKHIKKQGCCDKSPFLNLSVFLTKQKNYYFFITNNKMKII